MAATPDIERAARLAAQRVEAMLVAMLSSGELGEVAVVVGLFELEPQKRVTTKARTVKVARGHSLVERAR